MRLGCMSTALAQIAFYNRLCPAGSISYVAPNYAATGMDFDLEPGLCDWSQMALRPPNVTSDPSMQAVAKFEYATSLVVQKKWGSGSYMLPYRKRPVAFAQFFGARVVTWRMGAPQSTASRDDLVAAIIADIDEGFPMLMHLRSQAGSSHVQYHWVVVDGYRSSTDRSVFHVHLNMGHYGFDDDWYNFDAPVQLRHFPDGSVRADGRYTHSYDDLEYKRLWSIHPIADGGSSIGGQEAMEEVIGEDDGEHPDDVMPF